VGRDDGPGPALHLSGVIPAEDRAVAPTVLTSALTALAAVLGRPVGDPVGARDAYRTAARYATSVAEKRYLDAKAPAPTSQPGRG